LIKLFQKFAAGGAVFFLLLPPEAKYFFGCLAFHCRRQKFLLFFYFAFSPLFAVLSS
jgi:hypothetical protein